VTAGADLSYVHVICSLLNKLPSASDVATNPFTLPSMSPVPQGSFAGRFVSSVLF